MQRVAAAALNAVITKLGIRSMRAVSTVEGTKCVFAVHAVFGIGRVKD